MHPHVTEFLEAVRGSGRRLLLVTNAHRGSLSLKMEKTCLHRFFDDIISSHDFGLAKEQQGFWRVLQDKHVFEKHSTLLVDDSLAVLRSAQAFGIAYLVSISRPDSRAPVGRLRVSGCGGFSGDDAGAGAGRGPLIPGRLAVAAGGRLPWGATRPRGSRRCG